MTTFSRVWNTAYEATPPGTEAANQLDTRIQQFKVDVRQRLEVEHVWDDTTFDGVHKLPYLAVAARDALTDKVGQIVLSSDASRISYNTGSGWNVLDTLSIGDLKLGAYTTPSYGWLACDGSSLLRAGQYADLFGVIDVLYGTVDGTHFTLPDTGGFVPIGLDSGDSDFDTLGKSSGTLTHQLITAETPSHTHVWTGDAVGDHDHEYMNANIEDAGTKTFDDGNTANASQDDTEPAGGHTPTGTNATAGGDGVHQNTQPSLVFNYFIRYL